MCPPPCRLAWEEPFGPVLPFMRVKTIEEAVEHVNTSRLALQVGGWAGALVTSLYRAVSL